MMVSRVYVSSQCALNALMHLVFPWHLICILLRVCWGFNWVHRCHLVLWPATKETAPWACTVSINYICHTVLRPSVCHIFIHSFVYLSYSLKSIYTSTNIHCMFEAMAVKSLCLVSICYFLIHYCCIYCRMYLNSDWNQYRTLVRP